jgi:hypothetical protein
LTDISDAESAAHVGAGVCFFIAAVTAVVAAASIWLAKPILGMNGWAFLDAGIFVIAGWRIWRFSKIWSVLALVIYFVERLYAIATSHAPTGLIMTIFFTLALISSVRGTFAYHSFAKEESLASSSAAAGQ